MNVVTVHLSLQQGIDRSGWKYRSIPPTRDRKICECENLHLKKKKRLMSMHEFTSRKGTHYMRIYTRWNYLLWKKLCHGKCRLNKFTPPPPVHDNLQKKTNQRNLWHEKVLKRNSHQILASQPQKTHVNLCIHCVKWDSVTVLVYIYLSIVAYANKISLRFPIVKEENERHTMRGWLSWSGVCNPACQAWVQFLAAASCWWVHLVGFTPHTA